MTDAEWHDALAHLFEEAFRHRSDRPLDEVTGDLRGVRLRVRVGARPEARYAEVVAEADARGAGVAVNVQARDLGPEFDTHTFATGVALFDKAYALQAAPEDLAHTLLDEHFCRELVRLRALWFRAEDATVELMVRLPRGADREGELVHVRAALELVAEQVRRLPNLAGQTPGGAGSIGAPYRGGGVAELAEERRLALVSLERAQLERARKTRTAVVSVAGVAALAAVGLTLLGHC